MSLNRETFRSVLGQFASGVTIVTSALDGEIGGMTVSAFSSVALEPHLVLVCLTIDKPTTKLVQEAGAFGVNILAAGQAEISNGFAFKDAPERFDGIEWSLGPEGMPLIAGSVAAMECSVVQSHVAGDHVVFIGEANAAWIHEVDPLVYAQGRYRSLAPD